MAVPYVYMMHSDYTNSSFISLPPCQPPLLSTDPFLVFSPFIFSPAECDQGHQCEHGFGTIPWRPVSSSVGLQQKILTPHHIYSEPIVQQGRLGPHCLPPCTPDCWQGQSCWGPGSFCELSIAMTVIPWRWHVAGPLSVFCLLGFSVPLLWCGLSYISCVTEFLSHPSSLWCLPLLFSHTFTFT